eukprot:ctg_551.g293
MYSSGYDDDGAVDGGGKASSGGGGPVPLPSVLSPSVGAAAVTIVASSAAADGGSCTSSGANLVHSSRSASNTSMKKMTILGVAQSGGRLDDARALLQQGAQCLRQALPRNRAGHRRTLNAELVEGVVRGWRRRGRAIHVGSRLRLQERMQGVLRSARITDAQRGRHRQAHQRPRQSHDQRRAQQRQHAHRLQAAVLQVALAEEQRDEGDHHLHRQQNEHRQEDVVDDVLAGVAVSQHRADHLLHSFVYLRGHTGGLLQPRLALLADPGRVAVHVLRHVVADAGQRVVQHFADVGQIVPHVYRRLQGRAEGAVHVGGRLKTHGQSGIHHADQQHAGERQRQKASPRTGPQSTLVPPHLTAARAHTQTEHTHHEHEHAGGHPGQRVPRQTLRIPLGELQPALALNASVRGVEESGKRRQRRRPRTEPQRADLRHHVFVTPERRAVIVPSVSLPARALGTPYGRRRPAPHHRVARSVHRRGALSPARGQRPPAPRRPTTGRQSIDSVTCRALGHVGGAIDGRPRASRSPPCGCTAAPNAGTAERANARGPVAGDSRPVCVGTTQRPPPQRAAVGTRRRDCGRRCPSNVLLVRWECLAPQRAGVVGRARGATVRRYGVQRQRHGGGGAWCEWRQADVPAGAPQLHPQAHGREGAGVFPTGARGARLLYAGVVVVVLAVRQYVSRRPEVLFATDEPLSQSVVPGCFASASVHGGGVGRRLSDGERCLAAGRRRSGGRHRAAVGAAAVWASLGALGVLGSEFGVLGLAVAAAVLDFRTVINAYRVCHRSSASARCGSSPATSGRFPCLTCSAIAHRRRTTGRPPPSTPPPLWPPSAPYSGTGGAHLSQTP